MKKTHILPVVLAIISCHAPATPIDRARAVRIARDFLCAKGRTDIQISQASVPQKIKSRWKRQSSEPFYIFNAANNGGYVIVSANDAFGQVIAYADSGSFSLDNAPDNVVGWMNLYARYIESGPSNDNGMAVENSHAESPAIVVQPLLNDISWGQDYPFNSQCPTYTSAGKSTHYYTGCVAAAATQIMKYYNYPERGTGQKSYQSHGQTLTADFGSSVYQWDKMLPSYPDGGGTEEQNATVAQLSAHFGIAVEMTYEPAGSGAYTMLVPTALKKYFNYDEGVTMLMRNYYSTSEWLQTIKNELDAHRPVFYGATSDVGSGGHAFVCDGYDSNGFVHINWGWYGKSNGYFMINHLNPSDLGIGGGTGGYNRDQEIVIGIQPPTGEKKDVVRPIYGGVRLGLTTNGPHNVTLMTIIENFDTEPFEGNVGAAITRNGQVIKLLKQEALQVKGFENGKSGSHVLTLRDINTETKELADGAYELRLVVRTQGAENWHILRHYTGFPAYADVRVENGVLTVTGIHQPAPDVVLTQQIASSGELYAGGYGKFKVALRNNSTDVRLKKLGLRFKTKDQPNQEYTLSTPVNVYEESSEDLTLLGDLPTDMPAGDYEVTAFDPTYPDYTFDDNAVGRTILKVLPTVERPVLRLEQAVEWQNANGTQTVQQGDNVSMAIAVRNYGAAGKASIVTFLQDTEHPERRYVFQQADITADKGQLATVPFYKKMVADPGTYRIEVCLLQEDGQYTPIESTFDAPTIQVEANPNVMLNVVNFDFPDQLHKGEKVSGSITFHAPHDFSGTFYLRMRQLTITTGEIIDMKNVSLKGGEEKAFNFNYTPSVVPGTYIVLIEAKSGGAEGTVGRYANCYKIVTVTDGTTGIGESITTDKNTLRPALSVENGTLLISNIGSAIRVEIFSPDGRLMFSRNRPGEALRVSGLADDVCIVRVVTPTGSSAHKIKLK